MALFVAGFPLSFGKEELCKLFEAYGAVKSAKVILDKETGHSRCFGFVEMLKEEEEEAAMRGLHGTIIECNNLTVKKSKPMSRQTETYVAPRWREKAECEGEL